MKELILKIFWGGLGDHLLYTPIPRLAKQKFGYDKVFISEHSSYRNPQTRNFVWERNPFVDGFTDRDTDYPKFSDVRQGYNILDEIVAFHGLPDDGVQFRNPEVYYGPRHLHDLRDAVIIDPNSINKSGVPSQALVESYFEKNRIIVTHQMKSLYERISSNGRIVLSADTLEELSDVIVSCKHLFCFTTGVATLASAFGKPVTVLFVPGIKSMFHHSRLHSYIDISPGVPC